MCRPKCYFVSSLIALTLLSFYCYTYLSRETGCLMTPTLLFDPDFSPIITALRMQANVIIALQILFLLTSWIIRCFLQRLWEILTYITIVCFLCNIVICHTTTHFFSTSYGAEDILLKCIEKYGEDDAMTKKIDFIQSAWECCGVHSFRDWKRNAHFNSTESTLADYNETIPASCRKNQQFNRTCSSKDNEETVTPYCKATLYRNSKGHSNSSKIPMRGIYSKGCIADIESYRQGFCPTVVKHSIYLPLITIFIIILRKVQQSIDCKHICLKRNGEVDVQTRYKDNNSQTENGPTRQKLLETSV